jgi:hypothetical protein
MICPTLAELVTTLSNSPAFQTLRLLRVDIRSFRVDNLPLICLRWLLLPDLTDMEGSILLQLVQVYPRQSSTKRPMKPLRRQYDHLYNPS